MFSGERCGGLITCVGELQLFQDWRALLLIVSWNHQREAALVSNVLGQLVSVSLLLPEKFQWLECTERQLHGRSGVGEVFQGWEFCGSVSCPLSFANPSKNREMGSGAELWCCRALGRKERGGRSRLTRLQTVWWENTDLGWEMSKSHLAFAQEKRPQCLFCT